MNVTSIDSEIIVYLSIMFVLGIILPITLISIWKIKTKAKLSPFFVGAGTFLLFSTVLEGICNSVLFSGTTDFSKAIISNNALFAILGALMAGLFEETGRFVAFKFFLKKHSDKKTAITYGIGHSGIEIVLILCYMSVVEIALIFMVNTGTIGDILPEGNEVALSSINQMVDSIMLLSSVTVVLAIVERLSTVVIHTSLSVVVFKAVKEKGKLFLYPVAILIHTFIDVFAGLYSVGAISNIYIVELLVIVFAVILGIVAFKTYKKMPDNMSA